MEHVSRTPTNVIVCGSSSSCMIHSCSLQTPGFVMCGCKVFYEISVWSNITSIVHRWCWDITTTLETKLLKRCPGFPVLPFMLQGRLHHPCNGDRFSEITTCGMNSSKSLLESVGQIFVICQILSIIVRLSMQYPCRIWDGCGNTECLLWIQSEIDIFDTTKGVSFTATFVIVFPGQSAISRNFAVKLFSAKVVNWVRKL